MARRPKETAKVETKDDADLAFVPCKQCGNPGDCARASRCMKGFK